MRGVCAGAGVRISAWANVASTAARAAVLVSVVCAGAELVVMLAALVSSAAETDLTMAKTAAVKRIVNRKTDFIWIVCKICFRKQEELPPCEKEILSSSCPLRRWNHLFSL